MTNFTTGTVDKVVDTEKMYKVYVGSDIHYGWKNAKPSWLASGVSVKIGWTSNPDKLSGKKIIDTIVKEGESINIVEEIVEGSGSSTPSTPSSVSSVFTPRPTHIVEKEQARLNLNFAKEIAIFDLRNVSLEEDRQRFLADKVHLYFNWLNELDTQLLK